MGDGKSTVRWCAPIDNITTTYILLNRFAAAQAVEMGSSDHAPEHDCGQCGRKYSNNYCSIHYCALAVSALYRCLAPCKDNMI